MGHKVNPLVFRLGITNNWKFNFKENKNWITNYLIYQLTLNHFMKYTIPHFNKTSRRNIREENGKITILGEKQTTKNVFIERSILFSHVNTGGINGKLYLRCFFYDYKFANPRIKVQTKNFNYLFSNQRFRKKKTDLFYRKQTIRKTSKPKKIKGRSPINGLINMGAAIWLWNLRWSNINTQIKKKHILKTLMVWIRLFETVMKKYGKKMRIFYINVFFNLLTVLRYLLKRWEYKGLKSRLLYVMQTMIFIIFSTRMGNGRFFQRIMRFRYLFMKGLATSMSNNLKSLFPGVERIESKYMAMRETTMTSELLTNLILVKLGQYFRLNKIVYPLMRWLKSYSNIEGFRILVSGRLTRKERAMHQIRSYKRMPLSTYKHLIDYHQDFKIMKFGIVGIKLYLFKKKTKRIPGYYYFKFQH